MIGRSRFHPCRVPWPFGGDVQVISIGVRQPRPIGRGWSLRSSELSAPERQSRPVFHMVRAWAFDRLPRIAAAKRSARRPFGVLAPPLNGQWPDAAVFRLRGSARPCSSEPTGSCSQQRVWRSHHWASGTSGSIGSIIATLRRSSNPGGIADGELRCTAFAPDTACPLNL